MDPLSLIRYDIVLVSYNSSRWLHGCVQALAALDYPLQRLHLIAVDNASEDDTMAKWAALQQEYDCFGRFTVHQNSGNSGFGAGCNHGAALGSAPYLLFLNLDTHIHPDALQQLDRGIALHPDGGMWEMRQYPLEAEKWYDPVTLETHWCSGAAVAMRRRLFERLGGFDEAIFMYCEDVDLSWRARAAGYNLYYIPRAQVEHFTAETYEGKSAYANRNILHNNYYLRLKYGTRADRKNFWEMLHSLQSLPEWTETTTGLEPQLRQLPKPHRPTGTKSFTPTFVGLSYDPWLYPAPAPCGPVETETVPTISILIRTHGRPQLLRQALQTIANQTVTGGLEVVVVEDGEPTAQAVIDDFADLPLHYHATGQPVGRSAAGNLALQLAKGDYCCFLDEDDWLLASYLETWQRLCIEHPGHRLFFAASMQLAGSYGADGVSWHTRRAIPMPVKDADWLTVALGNPVPIQAVLFHRSLYCQLGGFDERLEAYEDWNLWQRYAAVEHPLCTERCTSVFKVPADPVAFARRELRMKQQLSLCIAMGRQYPVATSMGQLAHHTHAAATAMQHYEPWVHAAEYDRTARQIAASRLWRATAPLRSMGHGLMQMGAALCGLQPPPLPRPPEWAETIEEEIAFIRYARSSPSWKVTEPLRRLGEWYKIRKKRF